MFKGLEQRRLAKPQTMRWKQRSWEPWSREPRKQISSQGALWAPSRALGLFGASRWLLHDHGLKIKDSML
jgi:hypothetical protein